MPPIQGVIPLLIAGKYYHDKLTAPADYNNQGYRHDTNPENLFSDGEGGVRFDSHTIKKDFLRIGFAGSDNAVINTALGILYELQPYTEQNDRLNMALRRLAELRNMSFETAVAQYTRALELRQIANKNMKKKKQLSPLPQNQPGNAEAKNNKKQKPQSEEQHIEGLDFETHPTFAGSTAQMRFGKILGDVFGLDPAIATIISPTGGIIGPDNSSKYLHHPFDPDGAVSIHGAIHDAAGFLSNAFDLGPGYDYLGHERNAERGNPMTGQTNIHDIRRFMQAEGLIERRDGPLGTILENNLDTFTEFSRRHVDIMNMTFDYFNENDESKKQQLKNQIQFQIAFRSTLAAVEARNTVSSKLNSIKQAGTEKKAELFEQLGEYRDRMLTTKDSMFEGIRDRLPFSF